jgi:hypothetical protein
MPIYPTLCVLAGIGVVAAIDAVRWRPAALLGLCALALGIQGLAQSIHIDSVLAKTDTRTLARNWMDAHIPDGAKVVVEPFVPGDFLTVDATRTFDPFPIKRPFQAYEKKLTPALVERYRAGGYCWVVVGSHQKDRGLAAGLKNAKAYYRALDRASASITRFSPYRKGAKPVPFSFDFSFNYEPRAYDRPGPLVEIHRLSHCA